MGVAIHKNASRVLEEQISDTNISTLYRIRDVMDAMMKELETLTINTSFHRDVNMFMLSTTTSDSIMGDKNAKGRILEYLKTFVFTYKYIDSIYLYRENNEAIIASNQDSTWDDFNDKGWYKEYFNHNHDYIKMISRKKNDLYPYYLSIIKPVHLNAQDRLGGVVVNINLEELGRLINNNDNSIFHKLFIIDENNSIIYNEDTSLITTNANDTSFLNSINDKRVEKIDKITLDNKKYIVSTTYSKYYDWSFNSFIPFNYYKEKLDVMGIFIVVIVILSVTIGIIASFFVSIKVYQPVSNILSLMENPHDWIKDYDINEEKANELKFIMSNIKDTFHSNQQKEIELEKRMESLNKAQAVALQAQINPHFLYNTLETINWMSIDQNKGENEVSTMITLVADLFKLSVETDSYLIPITNEIDYAKKYIKILKKRYPDRFSVTWNIDEQILQCKILKLCLQPLLENAIYHGIKPKSTFGEINIKGRIEDEYVVIDITDNGVGISESEVKKLNKNMNDNYAEQNKHIGIKNVNQRIKLIFGNKYGINIHSELGKGMTVQIKIPKINHSI